MTEMMTSYKFLLASSIYIYIGYTVATVSIALINTGLGTRTAWYLKGGKGLYGFCK